MFTASPHPYLVIPDQPFQLSAAPTCPPADTPPKKELKKQLANEVEKLRELQEMLYAHDYHSVLLIFQAMDAAGKDSTIRQVLTGVNPAGCQVFSFKQPSNQELDHDFLWRTSVSLPERGRIGVFNRSYYEEVLVVRVHPEYLSKQQIELPKNLEMLWQQRFESIRNHEKHLANNGTLILKFWLNVSKEEQRQRFLSRLDEPEKHWKFSAGDVAERAHWNTYMHAYLEALQATSKPWAPWYAIPADNKAFMHLTVAELVVASMEQLGLQYPKVKNEDKKRFEECRKLLEAEG
jgi:PPK2 family polyphosphate:nucleotide phosphotransferase